MEQKEYFSHRRNKKYKNVKKSTKFSNAFNETFFDYLNHTKINGLWMLQRHRVHGIERWIWSAILITLILLGILLTIFVWDKFYSSPTIVTIATNLPAAEVPYPGLTICSARTIVQKKLELFVKTINIPKQYSENDAINGLQTLDVFTERQWRELNQTNFMIADSILSLNNMTVHETIIQISAGCTDFLNRCYWTNYEFPCFQNHSYLTFKESTSYLGRCCSFNYNARNQSYVPFEANSFGQNGGLTIVGTGIRNASFQGKTKSYSTGLMLLVHHPNDFAVDSAPMIIIKANSEMFTSVYPTELSVSSEALDLNEEKRNCLVADDIDEPYYRQPACTLDCRREEMYRVCGCHPYHLPYPENGRIRRCKPRDALCFIDNYDNFQSMTCEHCLPNCFDIKYSAGAHGIEMITHNYSVNGLYYVNNLTHNNFIMRIYLAKQSVPSNQKIVVMSWVNLLANLGGVLNLCLGLSVISIVELFYFFTFRIYKNYQAQQSKIPIVPE